MRILDKNEIGERKWNITLVFAHAFEDVISPFTGDVLVKKDEPFTPNHLVTFLKEGIDRVAII